MISFGKSNATKILLGYEEYKILFYLKKYGFQKNHIFQKKQVASMVSLVPLQNEDHTCI